MVKYWISTNAFWIQAGLKDPASPRPPTVECTLFIPRLSRYQWTFQLSEFALSGKRDNDKKLQCTIQRSNTPIKTELYFNIQWLVFKMLRYSLESYFIVNNTTLKFVELLLLLFLVTVEFSPFFIHNACEIQAFYCTRIEYFLDLSNVIWNAIIYTTILRYKVVVIFTL